MKLVQDHPMPTRKPGQVRHSSLQPFIHTGSGSSLLWELYDTCLTLPPPCAWSTAWSCSLVQAASIQQYAKHVAMHSSGRCLYCLRGASATASPRATRLVDDFRCIVLVLLVPVCLQVLVRIHSSTVNPVDTAIRSGALPIKFPKVGSVLARLTWVEDVCALRLVCCGESAATTDNACTSA
jgi:hypothetical protein